ncbi:MAG TPA: tetratricopeptide repeat protein [Bacteroidia bacterium]|jgi:hypothetical protein
MISNCLTFEQLRAYSASTLNQAESGRFYMHISSCELCACAVNGFTAIPFASDELVAIHREIDARTNAAAANPLTFARVIIVAVSLLSIAGISIITSSISYTPLPAVNNHVPESVKPNPPKNETQKTSEEEISAAAKTFKKIISAVQYQKFERTTTPVEQLDLIKPGNIIESTVAMVENDIITPRYNPGTIYIYDLKVADYNKLYFTSGSHYADNFRRHTPVFKENETSLDNSTEEIHIVAADRILKKGLASFNRQEFGAALENFGLLLENNPADVNAQFYSALAFYNLGRIDKAVSGLEKVLENTNTSFYPEAQWYLALLNIKAGNFGNARLILERIVAEKGFYARKAADKLKWFGAGRS